MRKHLLIYSFIIISLSLSAQNVYLDWAKAAGDSKKDVANSNITDKQGNVYAVGYYSGKVDFNPSKDTFFLSANGVTDIFILKLDKKGEFVWAKSIGGTGTDEARSISADTFGNIYIAGFFENRVDFNPDTDTFFLTSAGGSDAFIANFNNSGDLIWANKLGSIYDDIANGVTVNLNGTVFFTGAFQDTIRYTSSTSGKSLLISKGKNDIFVARLDSIDTYFWIKSMGGSSDDVANSIISNIYDDAITTGYFSDKANFATGSSSYVLTSFGSTDAFISKLDGKGNYSFASQLGGSSEDIGKSVKIDNNNNILSTGWFNGTADFNPSKGTAYLYSNGNSDIYISKLNSAGAYSWAKQIGGTEDDKAYNMILDANNDIYSTGFYEARVDFDPSTSSYFLTSKGKEDIYISKLNSSGNFVWAKSIGGNNNDCGLGIYIAKDKSIFTVGYFSDTADFNTGKDSLKLSSNGYIDLFVQKLAACTTSYGSVKAAACYSVTVNGENFTSSGTYYQKISTTQGCDSIIILDITIYNTTIGNIDVVACKSYTLNGTTYTQAGTYYQTIKNYHGCDSIIVLNLTFGETNSSVNAISCDNYTLNGYNYNSSGTYKQVIKNHLGCDSTITLNLTIKKSTSNNLTITACNSFYIKNTEYTKSGIYKQTIKNKADCDSFITLNLTVYKSTDTVINAEACSTYSLNSIKYNKSGTYKQLLKNHNNCDSLITLNLKINNTSGIANIKACRSFTIGGNTYSKNGTYDVIIPNSKGCDSLLTLNLTIFDIDNTVTVTGMVISANQKDAQYQWLDCKNNYTSIPGAVYKEILVKNSGNYSVRVSKDVCIDTSECVLIDLGRVDNISKNLLKISPNPASDYINIEIEKDFGICDLKIYNNLSQVVYTKNNILGGKNLLNIYSLSKGLYYIEISNNKETLRSSFLKN